MALFNISGKYVILLIVALSFLLRPEVNENHVCAGSTKYTAFKAFQNTLVNSLMNVSLWTGRKYWATWMRTMLGNRPKDSVLMTVPIPKNDKIIYNTIVPDGVGYEIKHYLPKSLAATDGPYKTMIHYHGGGMVIGSSQGQAQYIASHNNVQIYAVEYRLAPEHPFPAGLDDVLHGTRYIMEHAEELNIGDFALVGESAGGYLTLVTAMSIDFEAEFGRKPVLAAPLIPMTQMMRFDTPSYLERTHYTDMPPSWMYAFWLAYSGQADMLQAGNHAVLKRNRHLSKGIREDSEFLSRVDPQIWAKDFLPAEYAPVDPLVDGSRGDLPDKIESLLRNPLFQPGTADDAELKKICKNVDNVKILVAELDILRDDGIMIANRLKGLCDNVELQVATGVGHLFPFEGVETGALLGFEEFEPKFKQMLDVLKF